VHFAGRDREALTLQSQGQWHEVDTPEKKSEFMAEDRKSILLRIPPDLWEQINRLAQSELRSTNAQMEFLLREALKARGIREKAGAEQENGDVKGSRS